MMIETTITKFKTFGTCDNDAIDWGWGLLFVFVILRTSFLTKLIGPAALSIALNFRELHFIPKSTLWCSNVPFTLLFVTAEKSELGGVAKIKINLTPGVQTRILCLFAGDFGWDNVGILFGRLDIFLAITHPR